MVESSSSSVENIAPLHINPKFVLIVQSFIEIKR